MSIQHSKIVMSYTYCCLGLQLILHDYLAHVETLSQDSVIIDLFSDTTAILNEFDLRSIIGCPGGMSTFRLYF